MKIAVTGAAGYVGNIVCKDLLDKGYQVKAIDNFYKGHADALLQLVTHKDFEFVHCDVSDKDKLKKALSDVDGIIHLAAVVGFPACAAQPAIARSTNVEGTRNIVECRPTSIPIVNASTGSVYGSIEGICKEESPLNTNTIYGLTKLEAEKILLDKDNTVSLRFATGFGVGPCMRVNLLVNDLVYQAINNGFLGIFEGKANRTFIHVRDMSRAFILCLEKLLGEGLKHKIYNVGDNRMNISKLDLAGMIADKTGASLFTDEFNKDPDCRDYIVDYSKINSEGFNCTISIEQGVEELIKATPLLRVRNPYG